MKIPSGIRADLKEEDLAEFKARYENSSYIRDMLKKHLTRRIESGRMEVEESISLDEVNYALKVAAANARIAGLREAVRLLSLDQKES
jgi:23S rRNA G2445 N2-methylase RlmL